MATETTPSTLAIEVEAVTKAFGPRLVLKGIDLALDRGDFLVLFGPNGAGKTTLIRILSTISRPTTGRVSIAGFDAKRKPVEARRLIGMVSHDTMLYRDLTAYENLRFLGKMYDVPELEERIHSLMTRVGLAPNLHQRVGTFSHGMMKRLSIARAFLHDPPVLLLDEPETGLDQQGIWMLTETLHALGSEKKAVVMTTHSLEHGLRGGTRIAILARGKIVYQEATRHVDRGRFSEIYRECTEATR
ncbi:MAG: ABC transporter ATP-binding protein [Chloroflexota bacterium]